jgi:hypothetical protein
MKSLCLAFFIVALFAELVTSLLQPILFSNTALDLHWGNTYYVVGAEPIRLLIWAPTFVLLSAAARFLLLLRRRKRELIA